jgi:hypothetical protein
MRSKRLEEVKQPSHIPVIFLQKQPCSRSRHNIPGFNDYQGPGLGSFTREMHVMMAG